MVFLSSVLSKEYSTTGVQDTARRKRRFPEDEADQIIEEFGQFLCALARMKG